MNSRLLRGIGFIILCLVVLWTDTVYELGIVAFFSDFLIVFIVLGLLLGGCAIGAKR